MMIEVKEIAMEDPLYQQERELRNKILLRPAGIPDFGWEMRDREAIHIVATEGEKVVGCLIYAIDSPESGQLMQMAVESEMQGKGVGQNIVNFLCKVAAEKGFKEITCHARESAVNFYLKCGFEIYEEPFQEAGIWHRHMRKTLSDHQPKNTTAP